MFFINEKFYYEYLIISEYLDSMKLRVEINFYVNYLLKGNLIDKLIAIDN